jgi:hypothetical protein
MSSIYYSSGNYRYEGSAPADHNRACGAYDCGDHNSNLGHVQESHEQKLEARRNRIERLQQSRQERRVAKAKDGKEIISRYLKSKNIDFRTNRILQIAGKTISVDFLLKDKNTMIKYWNPVEILALEQQPEYRRNCYEKYLESWKGFCGEYLQAGGKIHQIISADAQEILAKLPLFTGLNGDEQTYALAKTEPRP